MKQPIKNLKKAIIGFMALGALGYITGCGSNGGGEAQTLSGIEQGVVAENPGTEVTAPAAPTTPPPPATVADPTNPIDPANPTNPPPTNPADPTNPPPPPAATTPVTCYRYGFVSNRDNGAENVFFADTCKNLDDPSHTNFFLGSRPTIDPSVNIGLRPGSSRSSNGPLRLTNNANTDHIFGGIAFKPDGTQMAYGDAKLSDPVFNPKEFVGDPNGGSAFTRLDETFGFVSDPDPRAVSWNSDGTSIAYVVPLDDPFCDLDPNHLDRPCTNITLRLHHIMIADPSGGNRSVLSATTEDQIFEKAIFHPEAGKLIYSEKKGVDPFFLKVLFSNGASSDLIERFQSGIPIPLKGFEPTLPPQGTQLAFVREKNGRNQIFRCNLLPTQPNGQGFNPCLNPEQLTNIGNNTEPSYTPDGQFIFFTSDRDGYSAIYKMKVDGSDEVRLTPENVQYRSAVVHPVSFTQ